MRASTVLKAGHFAAESATDRVTLDHDARHRRRIALSTEGGAEILLDLAEATRLRHGDGLLLDDGRVVLVQAAPENLVEIRGTDALSLLRIAWHLGNRHLPTQLFADRLVIRHDHVIVEMVRGLGGSVTPLQAPFDPEGGAYGHGAVLGHKH